MLSRYNYPLIRVASALAGSTCTGASMHQPSLYRVTTNHPTLSSCNHLPISSCIYTLVVSFDSSTTPPALSSCIHTLSSPLSCNHILALSSHIHALALPRCTHAFASAAQGTWSRERKGRPVIGFEFGYQVGVFYRVARVLVIAYWVPSMSWRGARNSLCGDGGL